MAPAKQLSVKCRLGAAAHGAKSPYTPRPGVNSRKANCAVIEDSSDSHSGQISWNHLVGVIRRARIFLRTEEAAYCAAAASLPVPNTMTFAPIGVRL